MRDELVHFSLADTRRSLPTRLRHCLRRYVSFLARVKLGECDVGHVYDDENPADFMTKFVHKAKAEASIEYAPTARHRVVAARACPRCMWWAAPIGGTVWQRATVGRALGGVQVPHGG